MTAIVFTVALIAAALAILYLFASSFSDAPPDSRGINTATAVALAALIIMLIILVHWIRTL